MEKGPAVLPRPAPRLSSEHRLLRLARARRTGSGTSGLARLRGVATAARSSHETN